MGFKAFIKLKIRVVFWVMTPCRLVGSKRHVGEPYFTYAYGSHICHFYFQVDNSALKKQDEYFSSQ